jgi:DNA-binding MarR family transcriptional regulator
MLAKRRQFWLMAGDERGGRLILPMDVGPIDAIVGFHLRRAYGSALRHFSDHFADLDLTQNHVAVLWLTHDHPGIAQTDLARRLRMDRATTMARVHKLEARGLLARTPSAEDRRRIGLHLTDEGEAVLREARRAIETHEAWLKSRLSPRDADTLIGLLRRIHE